MQFTIPKSTLSEALASASSVIKRSAGSAALAHVKIECGETVTLTATDLDIWSVQSVADATVQKPGSCLVITKKLSEQLALIQGDLVTVTFDGKSIVIKTPEARAVRLAATNADDFPQSPKIGNRSHCVADLSIFNRLTKSMMENDTKLHLYGVLVMQSSEQTLTCYSGNGSVFAKVEVPFVGKLAAPIFIPAPHVSKLTGLGSVNITSDGPWIALEALRATTIVKRFTTEPAAFAEVLGKIQFDASALVDREDVLRIVDQSHRIRPEGQLNANMTVTQGDSALSFLTEVQIEKIDELTPCRPSGNWGNWKTAILPTDNLLDFLRQSKSESVTLHFGDRTGPVKMGDGVCEVFVMPMRPV